MVDQMTTDIASPWVLGLYALAAPLFIVGARMAGWYGGAQSALFLFPFAAIFGGMTQFLAAAWAFRTRQTLATAMLGTWSAFWMAYGVLNFLFATHRLTAPTGAFPELGFWFIALAAITWIGTAVAIEEHPALGGSLGLLAIGSTLAAIGDLTGSRPLGTLSGWLFLLAGIAAWYTASSMMFAETSRRGVTRVETPTEHPTAVPPHRHLWRAPRPWRRAG
jgi:succinate-acetate transporter protein